MNNEQQAWINAVTAIAGVLDARVNGYTPPTADKPLVVAAELVVYLIANHFTSKNDLVDWVLSLPESNLNSVISNPLPKRK